jgi:outer membrane protein assembly factor BamB
VDPAGPDPGSGRLPSGVLVVEGGRTLALAGDGRVRWSRPFATEPGRVVVDRRRGRVYVGSAFRSAPVVRALSLAPGATAWRTRAGERARLLSVGRGGRVYVGIDAAGRRAARGLRLATRARVWEHRTSRPVLGVRELAGGAVAIAAGYEFAGSSGGRLTIIAHR